MYKIFYCAMIIGFLGVSFMNLDIKTRIIGILLSLVNGLIFWK